MQMSRASILLFAGSLLLPLVAFAANTNKKTMHLYEEAKIEGKLLTPGDYKVEWSGSGPNVELSIVQSNDTVIAVPAKIVAENTSNNQDGYVLQPAKSGGQAIEEIFFHGMKYDLQLQPPAKTSHS